MYAKVLPAIRLPRELPSIFDYRIPEALKDAVTCGSIVRVPWRGKDIEAIVTALSPTSDIDAARIKDIVSFGADTPVPEDLIRIIRWCGAYYFISPATVAKSTIPATPKRKIVTDPPTASARTGRSQKRAPIREIIRYATPDEKFSRTALLLKSVLQQKRSAIVIVPHASDVEPTLDALHERIADIPIIPFHGGLNTGKMWQAWQDMSAPGPTVVVGTRMAVFAPLHDLSSIVIHESDSADLKQYDQNPRFDCRRVARARADMIDADMIYMSHAPRIEESSLTDTGFTLVMPPEDTLEPSLVDLSGSAFSGTDELLPPSVMKATEKALQSGKKVLFFHNRRGVASALLCKECGYVFRCAVCKIALTVHGTGLHCHRCGSASDTPLGCPECNALTLRTLGFGTARLEQYLKKSFPDARISRQDAESRERGHDADIMIGTRLILHDLAETETIPSLGAIIATDIDSLLSHPGFRTSEDAWRTIRTLKDIAAASSASLQLMTTDTDNPAIRRLLTDYPTFVTQEQKDRAATGYPPARTLISVIAFGKTESEATEAAVKVKAGLERLQTEGTLVRGPIRPNTPFRHGKYRSVVVIKMSALNETIVDYLISLPEPFVIDRDPEYIT